MDMDGEKLVSATEAAKIVGVAPRTLIYWITNSKILPGTRVGSTFAVKIKDVMKANELSLSSNYQRLTAKTH